MSRQTGPPSGLSQNHFAAKFGNLVSGLTNHRDVAVAEAACLLAQYWQLPVSIDFHPLPLTYRLALDGDPDHENALLDPVSGAMRIEVDLGWTQMLRPVARRLAELADCEEMNIRQRAATNACLVFLLTYNCFSLGRRFSGCNC